MHDVDRPQLETPENELDRFIGPGPRGQAGRSPGARFAAAIRRLGFLPTQHFVDRINQRAATQGIRWDPRIFPSEFTNARHFRQTRPGHNTRIAVVRGVPIVYRVGGKQGDRVVLITALPPNGALPPVVPTRYPAQREVYEYEWETRPKPKGKGYRDHADPSSLPPRGRFGWPPSETSLEASAALGRMARANRALHAARKELEAALEAKAVEERDYVSGGLLRGTYDTSVHARVDAALAARGLAQREFDESKRALEAVRQKIRAGRRKV